MTTQDLSNQLTSLLKSYIKQQGFVSSGKLVNSISFNVSDTGGDVDISLSSVDYLQYLDKGQLLDKFFNTKSVQDVILRYTTQKIQEKIDQEFSQ